MDNTQNSPKCASCFLPIDKNKKVEIDGKNFHKFCGTCCACYQVPKDMIKFFFGQLYCEECFHRHIPNRNRDNRTEFFNRCFNQWMNNAQRDKGLKLCMVGRGASSPLVFMAPPASFRGASSPLVFMPPPASFRVDAEREAGMQSAESKCHPSLFRLRKRTSAGTYVKE